MNFSQHKFEFLLLGSAIAYLLLFAGVPIIYTVFLSFQEVDPFKINQLIHKWVGLRNYIKVISAPDFWPLVKNTLFFLFFSVSIQFLLGLGLAMLLRKKFYGASFIRGMFMVSWIVPAVTIGVVWVWMFSQQYGVINYLLMATGVIQERLGWLTTTDLSLTSVTIANIWLGIPFNMIFLTVGLMAIPEDLYEAAKIDGANAVKRFFYITLPMMKPTIATVISLGIIFTFQQFDLFAAMTNGGPAGSSTVMQYRSWELSFQLVELGKGAALATIMLALVGIVGVIYIYASRSEDT